MVNFLSTRSPAKLNLFLHVLGRRDDGYHDLQTVFRLLDFGDDMAFSKQAHGVLSLHCDGDESAELPMDDNLVLIAARLLRERHGQADMGVGIQLTKSIPHGAGLGGGSSNAATTLTALNILWDLKLSTNQLCEIGQTLGADVPVFLSGVSAWGEGIGEKLTPLELPNSWYVVVTPRCCVSTKEIFSHQQLTRNSPAIKMADFLAGRSRNDCEFVTTLLYPEVANAMKTLEKFAVVRMTGTGSSVFAEFETESEARVVAGKLPTSMRSFVAKGINSLNEMAVET